MDRLTALGYATYDEYLRSPHWTDFKVRYRRSALPQSCAVCGRRQVELHHHTYLRIGAELLTDMTPLCREHHSAVHEWLTANRRGVGSTSVAVRRFKVVAGRTPKKVNPHRHKKRKNRHRVDTSALHSSQYYLDALGDLPLSQNQRVQVELHRDDPAALRGLTHSYGYQARKRNTTRLPKVDDQEAWRRFK